MTIRALVTLCLVALLALSCKQSPPTEAAKAPSGKLAVGYFYTDIDGTLAKKDQTVHPAVLEAIEAYKAAGGHVGVATGRLPESGLPFAGVIGADLPCLFANGAIITTPSGEVTKVFSIPEGPALDAVCAAIEVAECGAVYSAFIDEGSGKVTHQDGCHTTGKGALIKLRARACKGHDALMGTLTAAKDAPYTVVESGTGEWRGVSIGPQGVTKGTSLQWVATKLGTTIADMAFVGDSGNDNHALQTLQGGGGRCFVVANGLDSTKASCATQLELTNEQGAVGAAVLQLFE